MSSERLLLLRARPIDGPGAARAFIAWTLAAGVVRAPRLDLRDPDLTLAAARITPHLDL